MSQKYTWPLLDFHVNTTDLTECGTEDRLKREEAFIGQHWLHAVSYASKIFGILHFCKEKHQTSLNTNSAFCSSLILSVSNTLFSTFFTFLAYSTSARENSKPLLTQPQHSAQAYYEVFHIFHVSCSFSIKTDVMS